MATIADFTFLKSMVNYTTLADFSWIISITIIFMTLLIITRDHRKWQFLALPVIVGWYIAGLTTSFLIWIPAGILFIIHPLTLETIGEIIGVKQRTSMKSKVQKLFGTDKLKEQQRKEKIKAKAYNEFIRWKELKRLKESLEKGLR